MKAEQRKELETNTLADKMGQAMRRVKTSPRRSFFLYVLFIVVVLGALFISYRWWVTSRQENSERWVKLYDASEKHLKELAILDGPTEAGKAARFQYAWIVFWDEGIRKIGSNSEHAMKMMKLASDEYGKLAEECKDKDPVFEPQALLGLAVVEETLAIQARSHLDKAEERYKKLSEHEKYKDTAQGKFAQDRLTYFKDEKKRAEMTNLYEDLQRMLRVPMQRDNPLNFGGMPPLPPPADKPDKEPSK